MLAMIEADRLGQMRTGAASGVATKYLARASADVLGVYGSGWQAMEDLTVTLTIARWAETPLAGVIVTSVDRDGTLSGPDLGLLRETLDVAGLVNTSQGCWFGTVLDYHAFTGSEVTQTHFGWDYTGPRGSLPFPT